MDPPPYHPTRQATRHEFFRCHARGRGISLKNIGAALEKGIFKCLCIHFIHIYVYVSVYCAVNFVICTDVLQLFLATAARISRLSSRSSCQDYATPERESCVRVRNLGIYAWFFVMYRKNAITIGKKINKERDFILRVFIKTENLELVCKKEVKVVDIPQ